MRQALIIYEVTEVLRLENVEKDIELPAEGEDVHWIHRTDSDEHCYFVETTPDTVENKQREHAPAYTK
jgi:hypothetical protein